eukprot:CAMPEP_0113877356 /NCGR_PEP_ID=MMETSP0780_2-20120614/6048_1 /TAXON_ID=652834 /ORGANISM="Palpitomonas bilix" /LENGTH=686 /DNA_ID=CAMNT_0000863639 /DNA_START=109 /DNA_END=2169 /DNA_ORIENTATION=+ /assembly_acc=CAM_ASM_000599
MPRCSRSRKADKYLLDKEGAVDAENYSHLAEKQSAFGILAQIFIDDSTDKIVVQLKYQFQKNYDEFCFILPQLCHYIVHTEQPCTHIEQVLFSFARDNKDFALLLFWTLRAKVGDCTPTLAKDRCMRLLLGVESCAERDEEGKMDSKHSTTKSREKTSETEAELRGNSATSSSPRLLGERGRSKTVTDIGKLKATLPRQHAMSLEDIGEEKGSPIPELRTDAASLLEEYLESAEGGNNSAFHAEVAFVNALMDTSIMLLDYPPDERLEKLKERLQKVNSMIENRVTMVPMSSGHERILQIAASESHVFRTNTRAPYILYLETCPPQTVEEARGTSNGKDKTSPSGVGGERSHLVENSLPTPKSRRTVRENREVSDDIDSEIDFVSDADHELVSSDVPEVYGESFSSRVQRLRGMSVHSSVPEWRVQSFLVKTRDDLRQESLAMQLIHLMKSAFEVDGVDAWLCPYRILPTSADTGLVSTVPDAISIDALKRKTKGYSLLNYFREHYGVESSPRFKTARRNFISSMAGYSLACYLLQIKDRHNGNIMIDSAGHILHIDFGFLLTNSPGGNAGFEKAPFKLTKQMVELMGGIKSGGFRRFQKLFFKGFLAVRRKASELLLLVRMLVKNSVLPCFAKGEIAVLELEDRLHLAQTDHEIRFLVRQLIRTSLNNWRTFVYDKYQRCFVGIR